MKYQSYVNITILLISTKQTEVAICWGTEFLEARRTSVAPGTTGRPPRMNPNVQSYFFHGRQVVLFARYSAYTNKHWITFSYDFTLTPDSVELVWQRVRILICPTNSSGGCSGGSGILSSFISMISELVNSSAKLSSIVPSGCRHKHGVVSRPQHEVKVSWDTDANTPIHFCFWGVEGYLLKRKTIFRT